MACGVHEGRGTGLANAGYSSEHNTKNGVTMETRHPVNNSAFFKNQNLDTKHIVLMFAVNQLSQS